MSVSSLTTTTKTNKNEIGSIQNIEKKKEAIKYNYHRHMYIYTLNIKISLIFIIC